MEFKYLKIWNKILISWTEEPERLQSMGSLRVGHDWVTSLWLFTFMHWRRKWQPTPVFLPRESQRWGNLVGCRLWGRTESDRLKRLSSSSSSSSSMVFPVVMYGCESWTVKKAEHWRIDAFKLWCWRRLLKVPWTVRRSNQSILKEIRDFFGRNDAKAETPVLWPPHVKSWLIGKDSDAGRD